MSPRLSQRVDRRRRVLADDSRNDEPLKRPRIFRGDDEGPLSRYSEAALQAINAPIARYIPFRTFSLVMWFMVGLVPIFGVMLLDQRRHQIAGWLGSDALRIFDVTKPGSLASWCASFAFAAAALVVLAIYSVRRHRRDDYRARFAMWQWVLVVMLLACVDSAVGLHGLLQAGLDRLLGSPNWGNGSAWWIGAWATVIVGTTVRLAMEMSASRRSIGWMLGGVVCYLWCGLVQLDVASLGGTSWARMSQPGLLLLGHHLTLFTLVSYARDVVREAMGVVEDAVPQAAEAKADAASKKKVTAKVSKPTKTESPKLHVAVDEDATESKEVAAKEAAVKEAEPKQPTMKVFDEHGEQPVDMNKLSRAERRRIKKEQRRKKAA